MTGPVKTVVNGRVVKTSASVDVFETRSKTAKERKALRRAEFQKNWRRVR